MNYRKTKQTPNRKEQSNTSMKTSFPYPRKVARKEASLLRNAILLAVTSILAASCSLAPPTIVRDAVGPQAAVAGTGNEGYLTVYTATAWVSQDDEASTLEYTDYDVNSVEGMLVTRVVNGGQDPNRISLPAGRYTIDAESETSGEVSVPILIQPGRLTVVHLDQEQDSKKAFAGIDSSRLVLLPDGQAIGFRAQQIQPSVSGSTMAAARLTNYVGMQQPKS